MDETGKIMVEQVDAVAKPPKARVDSAIDTPQMRVDHAIDTTGPESAGERYRRKRDYLAGFLAEQPPEIAADQPGGAVYDAIIETLKSIYDPEIPVNIYDLGLIYGVEVSEDGHAVVSMTLTTPNCPVAESMPGEIEMQVGSVPGVGFAEVNLVWDPPWDPGKMSDEAKLELGML
ncbi:SUF system Fe-S cluster assembly protein [Blastomonas sp.]|uniref:SUF system Fe-S cluster assembly protein n=1 Tax=Blastomonas sp. TaxID=1909299 RepID=UPI0035934727